MTEFNEAYWWLWLIPLPGSMLSNALALRLKVHSLNHLFWLWISIYIYWSVWSFGHYDIRVDYLLMIIHIPILTFTYFRFYRNTQQIKKQTRNG